MGNYEQLKQSVAEVIKSNGNQEITGAILQNSLLTIISTVGSNATFAGIANPETNPGTPDQNVFYLASEPGVYANFGGIELTDQVLVFTNKNGNWESQDLGIATFIKVSELSENTWIKGKYINADGIEVEYQYAKCSPFLKVKEGIELRNVFSWSASNGKILFFYDKDFTYIGGFEYGLNELVSYTIEASIIPEDAVYFRVNSRIEDISTISELLELIPSNEDISTIPYISNSFFIQGKYIGANGIEVEYQYAKCSPFLKVKEGIELRNIIAYRGSSYAFIFFFDKKRNFISSIRNEDISSTISFNYTISASDIPEQAVYFRVNADIHNICTISDFIDLLYDYENDSIKDDLYRNMWIKGKYIGANGIEVEYQYAKCSPFLKVKEGIELRNVTAYTADNGNFLFFYDKNLNYISSKKAPSYSDKTIKLDYTIQNSDIPIGAEYFRTNSNINDFSYISDMYTIIPQFDDIVKLKENPLGYNEKTIQLEQGGINTDGTLVYSTIRVRTVPFNTNYEYELNEGYIVQCTVQYDKNFNFIKLGDVLDVNTEYIRLAIRKDDNTNITTDENIFKSFSCGLIYAVKHINEQTSFKTPCLFSLILNKEYIGESWSLDNDHYVNNRFGWDNMLLIDREYTILGRYYVIDFEITQGGTIYFGSISNTNARRQWQSLFSVNFSNSTLNIHNVPSENKITDVYLSKEFIRPEEYTSKRFRVIIRREIKSVFKFKLINIIDDTSVLEFEQQVNETIGRLFEKPFVFSDSVVKIYNYTINVNIKDVFLYITGDSITEGAGATNNANAYAYKIAEAVGQDRCIVSGRSGGNIDNVLAKIESEVSVLKPKYTMITIGINGGNTTAKLKKIIDRCKEIGTTLILNHTPATTLRIDDYKPINETIDNVIKSYSYAIPCIKFDVATSNNRNLDLGPDTTMLSSDGLHPSDKGHNAMYIQSKIDAPFLYNL